MRASAGPGRLDHQVQFVGKVHLLPERRYAALGFQQAHRNGPAVASLADEMAGLRHRTVEEHFVEFGAAGQLPDSTDVDARLIERQQQKAKPTPAPAARLAAREHEYPVGLMRQ